MTPGARRHLLGCQVDPEDVAFLASGAVTPSFATAAVTRFRDDTSARMLVLSGVPGCGKTVAASGWLLSAQRYGVDAAGVLATNWDSSARIVKAASLGYLNLRFNERDRAEFDSLKSLRWLVLDDVGTEPDDAVGLIRALIDHRYGHPVLTVITTMLAVLPAPGETRSRFEARYGAAMVGRLAHRGWLVPCGSQSLRGRQSPEEVSP